MDDAGRELLERIESIMLDIRDSQLRMEESADILGRQRAADAARKKIKRAEERAEHRPSEPHSHTPNVAPPSAEIRGRVRGNPRTPQSLVLSSLVLSSSSTDLAKKEQKKEIAASVEIRGQTWDAYSKAYAIRYGAEPSRNAKINSQIKQFVARLGAESPDVAAFYVTHPGQYYAVRGHAIGLLLADAEKLRTEWFTQKPITATQARLEERTATNLAGWEKHLKGDGNAVG